MTTRTQVAEDAVSITYEVRNGAKVVGYDREPKLTLDETNAATLRGRAGAALDVNAAFLAIPSPTNAQTLTQVQRLTRECTALIRLLLGRLEDTTGT